MRLIAIALLATACVPIPPVTTDFTPLEAPRPAVAADRVELVFGGRVDRPYREIGLASVTVRGPDLTQVELLAKLRMLGASNGCDALLVNPTAYTRMRDITSAVCIAYR